MSVSARIAVLGLVLAFPSLALGQPIPQQPLGRIAPLSEYSERPYGGFKVFIHQDVFAHKDDPGFQRKPLDVLKGEFETLLQRVPSEALAILRPRIHVWVEWDRIEGENADAVGVFRGGSAAAMRAHNVLAEKANGIELISLRKITMTKQPGIKNPVCVLLHEMAHAYHHQVIGSNNAAIKSAYQQAMDRKLYSNVKDLFGKRGPAYAATNEYEYFAELSEAYLVGNDFYPFDRQQLREYDIVGYRLCEEAWASVKNARELGHGGAVVANRPAEPTARPSGRDELQAQNKLDSAKGFLASNDREHARSLLSEVMKAYPRTLAAREAQVLLGALSP